MRVSFSLLAIRICVILKKERAIRECGWLIIYNPTRAVDLYNIKAIIRATKTSRKAATAMEALQIFREMQAQPFLRACTVLRQGVIIGPMELESAARRERD